jgi:hypothetical protein
MSKEITSKQNWMNHPWVLLLVGALFGAIFGQIVPQVWDWAQHRNDPSAEQVTMEQEMSVLTALRPGGQIADLPGILGVPSAEVSMEGHYRRSVFVLRDAAVLALSDKAGRVLMTSVTAFNTDFHPTFETPDGDQVTLWRSHIADVQSTPQTAIGHVGANDAFYYEWTGGPSHVTEFRQGFFGYSFAAAGDLHDNSFDLFMPFIDSNTDLGLPYTVGETAGLPTNWMDSWNSAPAAKTLRSNLLVNTVGYQASDVEALPIYPAVYEAELWPHR